jgi:hypothetical protein
MPLDNESERIRGGRNQTVDDRAELSYDKKQDEV